MEHTYPTVDLGHEQVRAFLDATLAEDRSRVPALLFTGPEGVGKEFEAVDLARRICCTRDPACRLDGELCESCEAAVLLENPGIHLVYPTPTQGTGEKEGDDEADIGKILDEKRQDFFGSAEFPKAVSLRVARARAIIRRANTKPFGSTHNVFVIVDAHRMREEAQNALLKIVEEPPARCAIIFVTPNPDAILYTIRSRCQRLRFSPLAEGVVESLLRDYYGIPAAKARKAAGVSQGSITRAKDIAAGEDDGERGAAYALLEDIRTAPESWVIAQGLKLSRRGNRDSTARFLHELALAYRDVMAADPALFINRDQAAVLSAQAERWPVEALPHIVDRIIDTRDGVLRRNLNIEAALVDLFLDIRRSAARS